MSEKITLRAILVDDEPLAIEGLALRLQQFEQIEIIGQATDGDAAIQLCLEKRPDVIFLDLQLPSLSGLEVVQALDSKEAPMVVFVSAYSEYALNAFELDVVDYLLKPVNIGRLSKTIDRLVARKLWINSGSHTISPKASSEQESPPILIKSGQNDYVKIALQHIRYIEAAGDYMCIHTPTENHIVRITMKKLQQQLDSEHFMRIHKSTIVNLDAIRCVKGLKNHEGVITLDDGIELKVSRTVFSELSERYQDRHSLVMG